MSLNNNGVKGKAQPMLVHGGKRQKAAAAAKA